MEIEVAIRLIAKGIDRNLPGQQWVDLGSGTGLFTKALAQLLPAGSVIHAVDKDGDALNTVRIQSGDVAVKTYLKDFVSEELDVENQDGIMMANSLHYVQDKTGFLKRLQKKLKPNGRIVIIEYDMVSANQWIPFPISFDSLKDLANRTGFSSVVKLDQQPSVYNRSNIYSAVLHPI